MVEHRNSMRRIKRIHMIGIGGVGMAGIAEVLLNLGYKLSGSDISANTMTAHLQKLGVTINFGHTADYLDANPIDVIVVSTAIDANNVELLKAKELRIPIVPRAQMLAELMRFKEGIAIAGTHGKTTTTSLVASLMNEAGYDPTFVIGGKLNSLGTNARLGKGKYFIVEACESDASFLHFSPLISVITNIDRDHLENYGGDFERLKKTYVEFLHQLPFYGLAVLCIDDAVVNSILPLVARPFVTYGFSEAADYQATDYTQKGIQSRFTVQNNVNNETFEIILNLPGKHNVLNALAGIAIALEEKVNIPAIQKALRNFEGIGRRFQILGNITVQDKQALLIDDYGHHPQEIKVVLEALRTGWPNRRIIMVYQPHRFSRTKELFDDFAVVLSSVDVLLLLEIYAAGETPLPGVESRALCHAIRARGQIDPIFVPEKDKIIQVLSPVVQEGDVILMQGAGDIGALALHVANALQATVA